MTKDKCLGRRTYLKTLFIPLCLVLLSTNDKMIVMGQTDNETAVPSSQVTTLPPTITTLPPSISTLPPTIATLPPTVSTSAPTTTPETPQPSALTPAPSVSTPAPTTTPETPEPTALTPPPTATTPAPTALTPPPTATTPAPTLTPTTETPTVAPVPDATPEPTTIPTTLAPTEDDSTTAPTTTPTTAGPSSSPSAAPTNKAPTEPPTLNPTDTKGTFNPTIAPSLKPSASPVSPGEPTATPSTPPPTRSPSQKEVSSVLSKVIKLQFNGRRELIEQTNLLRLLQNAEELDTADKLIFSKATSEWTNQFYEDNPDVLDVNTVSSEVIVDQQQAIGNTLTIAYDERIKYWTSADITPEEVSNEPLSTKSLQDGYVDFLKSQANAAGSSTFNSLSSVTVPNSIPTAAPTTSGGDDGFWTTGTIIGISVGGAAALLLLLGGGYWAMNRNKGSDAYIPADKKGDVPPATIGGYGNDDISTLEDPTAKSGMRNPEDMGYGDQSVATMDYDYAKAYGGEVDHSVSDAGGTFGSQTRGDSTALGAMGAAAGVGAGASLASDEESSFDRAYRPANPNTREETFDIYAPCGKLGVVIDTPDDGAPCVHAIKDSSVIADKLQVGDKLLAVDDQDVRSMTAIKVSKLISRKSNNPTRKLTIGRTIVIE